MNKSFFILIFLSFLNIFFKSKNIILILILLENCVIIILMNFITMNSLFFSFIFFILLLITEAIFGLVILTNFLHFFGSEKTKNFSI